MQPTWLVRLAASAFASHAFHSWPSIRSLLSACVAAKRYKRDNVILVLFNALLVKRRDAAALLRSTLILLVAPLAAPRRAVSTSHEICRLTPATFSLVVHLTPSMPCHSTLSPSNPSLLRVLTSPNTRHER